MLRQYRFLMFALDHDPIFPLPGGSDGLPIVEFAYVMLPW